MRITLSSTVEEARRALTITDQAAVVVWDRETPVGVLTFGDVSSARHLPPGALVEDVLSHECVWIDPAADEAETCHRYTDAAWSSLKRRRPLSQDTLERRVAATGAGA